MDAPEHTIVQTASAIHDALSDVLAKAAEIIDVTPYLDGKGRLPFGNILPMLRRIEEAASASHTTCSYYWPGLVSGTEDTRYMMPGGSGVPIRDTQITEMCDELMYMFHTITIMGAGFGYLAGGYLHVPNCRRIGTRAFILSRLYGLADGSFTPIVMSIGQDESSFASLEELGAEAFCSDGGGIWAEIDVTFPVLRTIGAKAFYALDPGVTKVAKPHRLIFPAAETIGTAAFSGDFGTRLAVSFPNLTKDEIRAMANYPFGLRSGTPVYARDNVIFTV